MCSIVFCPSITRRRPLFDYLAASLYTAAIFSSNSLRYFPIRLLKHTPLENVKNHAGTAPLGMQRAAAGGTFSPLGVRPSPHQKNPGAGTAAYGRDTNEPTFNTSLTCAKYLVTRSQARRQVQRLTRTNTTENGHGACQLEANFY